VGEAYIRPGERPEGFKNKVSADHQELFQLSADIRSAAFAFLEDFNSRQIRLINLAPHKRLFLFFLTRALKTYSAVQALCREGYGQDVYVLLRNMLEMLISMKYILVDERKAAEKAVRFVEYKWVIFKRSLPDEGTLGASPSGSDEQSKRARIMERFEEFKKKYRIGSDRGLLTWSGRSVRDMAKTADPDLLKEYDRAFRQYSKFSHPGIIGDREYVNLEAAMLHFSPLPAGGGSLVFSLKSAVTYVVLVVRMFNDLFRLGYDKQLDEFSARSEEVFKMEKYAEDVSPGDKTFDKERREEITVFFDIEPSP
jgi:hypothetical protein